ncbi:MAG: glycosyltransferase family 2 protein [Candidatus Latescibacteria bacterium]|nr:glycosyltransferase family 2 protein [Candidatus Latescibacterota bacterium]
MSRPRSTLVILTLNEIEGVTALFDRIPLTAVDECLVVDGGSTDGTIEFFRQRGLRVVVQDVRGRGEAFRVAMREAQGENLVFFSPDGNEDPADIPRLIAKLDEGYAMVIGSRFLPGGANEEDERRFPWRAWANQAFTMIANGLWGGRLTDSINGFRAMTRQAFLRLNPDGPGFVIEYQMSIRALKLGLPVAEIPTREGPRIGGRSGARSIPTGLLFLRYLLREVLIGRRFQPYHANLS